MFLPQKITLSSLLLLCLFGCNNRQTLFVQLPSSDTHIDFINKPLEKECFGILYYLYYYNGGGVATGDINGDGLPDIYFSANNNGGNKLYINKGKFKFEDITTQAGVAGTADWCTGVTMADVNADGKLDIYVAAVAHDRGLQGHNQLFINDGCTPGGVPHFTESSAAYGLNFSGFSTQAAFFDYDHDGDLDCYILNQSHRPNENIVDTANRRKIDLNAGDKLYRNDLNTASNRFTDVSAEAGIFQSGLGYGLGISVADINNDGWEDIYIGNDFHENDYYYVNKGDGTFEESGARHFGHYSRFSMGNDIADYNNDGQADLITVDMLPADEKILKTYGSDENADIYKLKLTNNGFQHQYSRNCLQKNNGNGSSFSDVALQAGVAATDWSWCPLFFDADNDGWKDLFITSGIVKRPVDMDYVRFISNLYMQKAMNSSDKYDEQALEKMPEGNSHPFFYKNVDGASFIDKSEEWGTGKLKGCSNGASYADLDGDGNVDMVVNCIGAPALILKNTTKGKNYLNLAFKGTGGNKLGIGAKAYVFIAGKMQYQQLMLTRGFESSSEPVLHFGLNDNKKIDSVLVVWPNQRVQRFSNVPANKTLSVDQTNAADHFDDAGLFPLPAIVANDVSAAINVKWQHKENDFNDFDYQPLLPHKQSTRGPKIATADVNKDGLQDFFVCGSAGQAGAMMLQNSNGQFTPIDTSIFTTNASDEVDAVFFDANGDGYPDLYVASGGYESNDGAAVLADKLYMNNGKGHFSLLTGRLPDLLTNKSCVAAADIDKDGDQDLFIGTLATVKKYGVAPTSYLLINDGKGSFSIAPTAVVGLDAVGMVTAAAFADMNNDGWTDLVVTGEWMPIKLFVNEHGHLKEADLPASTGLWQTIFITDVNGDGHPDILGGNWGHNSKLYAGKTGPLKLYVKDFDRNGTVEQVMAYNLGGEEYTFLAKDELERTMPVLKKAYLTYSEVAGKTVKYMFFDLFTGYTELKAEVLGSSCFINNGRGSFTRVDLPEPLQQAPIFAFAEGTTKGSYIAAGNFYGVIPYEGRYDALLPSVFSMKNTTTGVHKVEPLIPTLRGETRSIQRIDNGKYGPLWMIARNDLPLTFLTINK